MSASSKERRKEVMRPWFRYTYTMVSKAALCNDIVDRKQRYTQHDKWMGQAESRSDAG